MKVNIGYYPIMDMFLAFRQLFSNERFRPFNREMTLVEEKITEEQVRFIEQFGVPTRGYLAAIQNLIDLHLMNTNSSESILLDIIKEPEKLFESPKEDHDDMKVVELLKSAEGHIIKLWKDVFSTYGARFSKSIFDKVYELNDSVKSQDPIEYLSKMSDRIYIEGEALHFNIKPDHSIKIEDIENIIIMPSIFASRDLTFWYSGNNYIFFVALESKGIDQCEPSDMLLLRTSALNDKTRLKMLRYMSKESCSAGDLAKYLNMNASTISRHLKLFKDTGFVEVSSQVGNAVIYTINKREIENALSQIKNYFEF